LSIALALVVGQALDILVGAITKDPSLEPHLGPLAAQLIPTLSQAVGESADQTTARRVAAEAIFAKYAQPIVAPVPAVPLTPGT
jgi:hypothetical protein